MLCPAAMVWRFSPLSLIGVSRGTLCALGVILLLPTVAATSTVVARWVTVTSNILLETTAGTSYAFGTYVQCADFLLPRSQFLVVLLLAILLYGVVAVGAHSHA